MSINLAVVCGGFAPVGGIEAIARELLIELKPHVPQRTLVTWGHPMSKNAMLREIAGSGVQMRHLPFRWGCRWELPDRLLAPLAMKAAEQADVIVLLKWFTPGFRSRLREAMVRAGRQPRMVYMTAYRPAEWNPGTWDPVSINRDFEALIVQARCFEDDLRQMGYRNRIAVIPYLPPDPLDPQPMPPGDRLRIGFLGRLEAQKNLGYLLDSLMALGPELENRGLPMWELHLFGDGSQRRSLEQQAAALGHADDVHFHGTVRGEAKEKALLSCHLFANSSTSEGQCLVAIEVISRGRPLVATPVGALPEVLAFEDLGVLAPLNDPRAFALQLANVGQRVLKGDLDAARIRLAYQRVFRRQSVTEKYVELFNELAGVKGAATSSNQTLVTTSSGQ